MSASNIHVLHRPVAPPAAFLRIGHTGHHKLEALLSANRLPFRRVVFDAAHARGQRDLLRAVTAAGHEVVLDLNVAETAAPGRFSSAVAKLPWGNPDRPWDPADFAVGRNDDFCKRMADFVVQTGATAVLAPTHAYGETDWLSIDSGNCERLRYELDRAGASDIPIDYAVIMNARELRDPAHRVNAIGGIASLPIENVWLRLGGFGATATGVGTRHVIEAVRTLHDLGRPLVIDMAGGFAALAVLAFGGVGGISHGVAQRESFDLAAWRKLPADRKGGGAPVRMYVSELDRYLDEVQAKTFFAVRGTKSRFGCADTRCCPNGIDDMMENAHAHFINQRNQQIEMLGKIPEGRRAEQFLLHHLDPALRSLRQVAKLKFGDESVQKLVGDAKSRLARLRDALGALHEADAGCPSRSRAPRFRGARGGVSALATGTGVTP